MRATENGANAVYLFIAELHGYKKGTEQGKLDYGKECYSVGKLIDLDYSTEEGQAGAHENIWLQRLYDDLDGYYGIKGKLIAPILKAKGVATLSPVDNYRWTVPIELDAGALTS